MTYLDTVLDYLRDLKPSQYGYILPLYDRVKLDEYAQEGLFPTLNGLQNALLVAAVLGISRLILTHTVMKVKIKTTSIICDKLKYSKPNNLFSPSY